VKVNSKLYENELSYDDIEEMILHMETAAEIVYEKENAK